MAQPDLPLARPGSCRQACHTMMWGFAFFLPLPVPFLEVAGWALLLDALRRFPGSAPDLRRLRVLGGLGAGVWVARAAALLSPLAGMSKVHVALYLATWAVLMVFVRHLCGLIAAMAADQKADTVAAAARRRRWLIALPFVAIVAAAGIPREPHFLAFVIVVVVACCVVWSLMGLMAATARMCALAEGIASGPPAAPAS